jgi:hypothetical protein
MGIWDCLDFGFGIADLGLSRFWIWDCGFGIDGRNKNPILEFRDLLLL